MLDGLNVQVAVRGEIASHKTSEVYDVLLTAMGKRRHPLLLSICAATGNITGIGKRSMTEPDQFTSLFEQAEL